MIESDQAQGENINIYPEVSGPITQVLVAEGEQVRKGDPLLTIDDSVERATTEQLQAQAEAALAMLHELKAEPRPETLAVAVAQVDNARATLKNARDQLAKEQRSYQMDPKAVSKNDLDNAINAERIAATNLEVVEKQYQLTKAGAWIYDIENQERTYTSLERSYLSAAALLAKYTIRAPSDGVVLAVQATTGSYVSTQGAYDSYTQGFDPLVVMGKPQGSLEVRAYIDEILVHELPDPAKMRAEMFIRGTSDQVPLTFVRVQPYISPEDRALRRARGAGRRARAAGHLPLPEPQSTPSLSGTAGRCLCQIRMSAGARGWRRGSRRVASRQRSLAASAAAP